MESAGFQIHRKGVPVAAVPAAVRASAEEQLAPLFPHLRAELGGQPVNVVRPEGVPHYSRILS